MNNAIARAQPCVIDRGSGTAYILLSESPTVQYRATRSAYNLTGIPTICRNPGGYVPLLMQVWRKDSFSVDRTSGRVFALPDTQTSKILF